MYALPNLADVVQAGNLMSEDIILDETARLMEAAALITEFLSVIVDVQNDGLDTEPLPEVLD